MGKIVKQAHGGALYQASKGETRNPHGRPRKLVSDVIKGMEAKGIKPVSMDEIKDIYLRLVNNTRQELQDMAKDPDQPMLTKLIIKAMTEKGKGFEVIERMFDRAIGKATQKQELGFDEAKMPTSIKIEIVE